MIFTSLMKILPTLRKNFRPCSKFLNLMIFFKFAELDYSETIKLSVQFEFGAYLTDNIQISIYPYSPEKVQFSSLIFGEHLIFPTQKRPHKAYCTKIIYLSVQIKLDKKVHLPCGSHPTSIKSLTTY